MSTTINLAVFGTALGGEAVTVQAERLGGDHLVNEADAIAILDAWIGDYPVSRNWGIAGAGHLILTDAGTQQRPDIWTWEPVAEGRYAIGGLPFQISRREFVRTVEDAAALDEIVAALYRGDGALDRIAAALVSTGRVVL